MHRCSPLNWQIMRGCFISHADTVAAYAGEPPLWVYTETAKPLTQLLGVPGYQRMVMPLSTAAYSVILTVMHCYLRN